MCTISCLTNKNNVSNDGLKISGRFLKNIVLFSQVSVITKLSNLRNKYFAFLEYFHNVK